MTIIVVGAGISGLTMALSLHQAGIQVRVHESARLVRPRGVGINLQPNAVRELTELGLGGMLAATGREIDTLSFFNKFGQLVWSEPRGIRAGFHWPQVAIHRGRLQAQLLEATRARIGTENILLGHRLTRFSQDADGVTAHFADPDSGAECATDHGSVLVAADGIHSAVRQSLYPDQGEPRFASQILWRGAVAAPPFLGGHTMIIAGHYDRRVVCYPVADLGDGRVLTNWLVQLTVPDNMGAREDWNRQVAKEKFWEPVRDWHFPWLDVPELIAQTEEILEFPLVDRDPVARWSFDRVTLIGDAAHPMHPVGSQAGSQAIVDARVLTQQLRATTDPVEALQRYEALRRPAMNDITLRNRAFGPEAALQLAEERAPDGFADIEQVIPHDELHHISQSFQIAAGLDPESVNGRPSFV